MKTKITKILMSLLLLLPTTAFAGGADINFAASLTNNAFKDVVRQIGMASAYRGVAPAEPQGITGFDIGAEVSFVDLDTDVFEFVMEDAPSYLAVPKLHLRKGLPFGIDLGLSYSQIPDSNIKLIGGEIQYAILDGSMATPALALRGSYSTLQGVDDLNLSTMAADVVVSKGVLMFTPYAGAGLVRINGDYTGDNTILKSTLTDQDMTETRVFAGVQFSVLLLRVTLDAELGDNNIYTAKVSLGF